MLRRLTLLAFLAAACAAPDRTPAAPQDITFADGDRIGGAMIARVVRIPEGVVVHVDDDLLLEARSVIVDGELRARDVALGDARTDAPRIGIVASTRITVRGAIEGGRGKCHADADPAAHLGARGGNGSDIVLVARGVHVSGSIRGGNGGQGGGSASGGRGGSLDISDDPDFIDESPDAVLPDSEGVGFRGGNGGAAGRAVASHSVAGASGGNGGGVHWHPYPPPADLVRASAR